MSVGSRDCLYRQDLELQLLLDPPLGSVGQRRRISPRRPEAFPSYTHCRSVLPYATTRSLDCPYSL